LEFLMPLVPREKPNHLLGIADVESIEQAVRFGVDTFDSCFPTRMGRHGTMLTKHRGKVSPKSGRFKTCYESPDPEGWGMQDHTMAYLHHLVKAHEPQAASLITLSNIMYMNRFMQDIREKILNDEI